MSSSVSLPEEDLSCPVCCDIFRDPVLLPCSHSFCKSCLQRYWDTSALRQCPVCRRRASKRTPLSNLALKNLCEALQQGRSQSSAEGNGVLCSLHGERLRLFCLVDKQPVCVVCQASKIHKNHDCSPIEKAAQDCKDELNVALKTLQDTLDSLIRLKGTSEEMLEPIKNQALETERQIKDQFVKLHLFLYDEEAARLAALKEEEEEKIGVMKSMMTEAAAGMLYLTETITVITQEMTGAEDMTLLQNFKATIERAQCTGQGPERISGALIDVAKHLRNLKYRVWKKMLLHVEYIPVTLDPITAHPCLFLSHDLTSLQYTSQPQRLPDNPERFHMSAEVLGMTGLSSGSHCWVVETGCNDDWILGVACMSVTRNVEVQARPENGFWTICLRDREYRAMTSPPTALTVTGKLKRVRVQLDWDKGQVSFFDPADDNDTPLYSFSHKFTEKVFPYFYTQSKHPLRILPERVCVTVQHSGAGRPCKVPD
ncbi:zinc-binding protein A33-like isoform X1 [Coregonus clupeaformis]|uniref:zinc-binding protein A33-like isoform X1 n=1 Tax=Coregonus clupeaformis TaxID=59861 RepID=UPI001E1C2FE3|nr:zinc-binding protein A33-like isoform X1 [Coregonus clupeaformis]